MLVASTWLDDHQGRPSAPTNSLHEQRQVRITIRIRILIVNLDLPLGIE